MSESEKSKDTSEQRPNPAHHREQSENADKRRARAEKGQQQDPDQEETAQFNTD